METIYLSPHFTLAEAIISETASRNGISNIPNEATLVTMKQSALGMERVRNYISTPIHVNSWHRALAVNRILGSKDSSQHPKGEAIDFISPAYGTPTLIAKRLSMARELIQFDQLILEHDWVHISFAILSGKPRYQVLSLLQNGSYAVGLTDKLGRTIT